MSEANMSGEAIWSSTCDVDSLLSEVNMRSEIHGDRMDAFSMMHSSFVYSTSFEGDFSPRLDRFILLSELRVLTLAYTISCRCIAWPEPPVPTKIHGLGYCGLRFS